LLLDVGADRSDTTTAVLGSDVLAGEAPQLLVPARHWQRARPRDDEPSLVSCVVVPGFNYADLGLGAS
jgi:predicted cupin superfamily sugar epimerase